MASNRELFDSKLTHTPRQHHEQEDLTCAICLQQRSAQASTTPCGHRFCRRCLDEWRNTSQNGDCPSCRKALPEALGFAEACIMVEEDHDAEAVVRLREVIDLCEHAPWAAPHYNLGMLLARQKDSGGAERHFRKAAELRSDDPDAALWWGKALLWLGRRGEASAALGRARRLSPDEGAGAEAARLLTELSAPTSGRLTARRTADSAAIGPADSSPFASASGSVLGKYTFPGAKSGDSAAAPARRGVGALTARQLSLLRERRTMPQMVPPIASRGSVPPPRASNAIDASSPGNVSALR